MTIIDFIKCSRESERWGLTLNEQEGTSNILQTITGAIKCHLTYGTLLRIAKALEAIVENTNHRPPQCVKPICGRTLKEVVIQGQEQRKAELRAKRKLRRK